MEIWKDIPFLDCYQASNLGNIRNKFTKRVLKQQEYCAPGRHKHIDMRVTLHNEGKCKTFKVHRLVSRAWKDDYDELLEVDHIDGNSKNNNESNLKMCTHKENMNNPISIKRMSSGQIARHQIKK